MNMDEGFEMQHRGKTGQETRQSSDDNVERGRGTEADNTEVSKVPSRQLDVSSGRNSDANAELTTLQKYINFLPTVAFSANTQASWEAVAVSFTAGLLNGGPVCTTPITPPSFCNH